MTEPRQLVLASSSPYRKEILTRSGLPFCSEPPDIDETPHRKETAVELVRRLSIEKAKALKEQFSNSLIIGSDQVAECQGVIMGKPADRGAAIDQIQSASGGAVTLYTGLALHNTETHRTQATVETYQVNYRALNKKEIEDYIDSEQPFDCCGSLKVEGAGIALLESITGNDPNTLMGLPLLKLLQFLRNENFPTPFAK